jgi:hypothetical protein
LGALYPAASPEKVRAAKLTAAKRAELRGVISTRAGLNRYLRVTPAGCSASTPRVVKAEENLDGKYLLRACAPWLSRIRLLNTSRTILSPAPPPHRGHL